jgi:hypothetical protein
MLRRLVLFVEGKGDRDAVPTLARRVLADVGGSDVLFVDRNAVPVHGLGTLVRNNCSEWLRLLCAIGKTRGRDLAAMLLLLDGDVVQVPRTWEPYLQTQGSQVFCARRAAALLASRAREARAGTVFSLATVFAMKEFETWLLAGLESLRGVALAEGRGTVPVGAVAPPGDVEDKRDAKGRLKEQVPAYQQTLDQAVLASHVDLAQVRGRCKSFRRFEHAIRQIVEAARNNRPIVSPDL